MIGASSNLNFKQQGIRLESYVTQWFLESVFDQIGTMFLVWFNFISIKNWNCWVEILVYKCLIRGKPMILKTLVDESTSEMKME